MTTNGITVEQALASHKLAGCVLEQLGGGSDDSIQSAIDAANNGADGGFCGFTYTDDCRDFVRANKRAIVSTLQEMAGDLGEDLLSMVTGFNCLGKRFPVTVDEVGSVVYGDGSDAGDAADMIYSALAWFALEEVGRAISDASER